MFTNEEKNLHRDCKRFKRGFMLLALLALCLGMPRLAAADVITDWNAIAIAAAATGQGPPQQQRTVAIMHAAIFDAGDDKFSQISIASVHTRGPLTIVRVSVTRDRTSANRRPDGSPFAFPSRPAIHSDVGHDDRYRS